MQVVEGMALVKQECCNLISNECMGMTTRGTLFRERGNCWIAEGDQCAYYDKCVHPLAIARRAEILKKKARKSRWK